MSVLSKEEKQAVALRCYKDPVLFCKTILPDWFPEEVPWVHRGLLAILLQKTDFLAQYGELDKICSNFVFEKDGKTYSMFFVKDGAIHLLVYDLVGIMMPRGFSKTTICNAALLYLIAYCDCKFPLFISETATHSEQQLRNVKRKLESGTLFREIFGDKVPDKNDPRQWTNDTITTLDNITCIARGRGGQVRGLNVDSQRPDVIIVDDLEDSESVKTKEQREKAQDWFYKDLFPARAKRNSRVIVMGTLLHEDALLMKLKNDPRCTFVRFGALDKQGEPLWEWNMSLVDLEALKQRFVAQARLSAFYMEYMSELRNDESSLFKQSYIRYGTFPRDSFTAVAIVLDPAISEKRGADSTSIVVVGMTLAGILVVLENWNKKGASPREQIDKYFELEKFWKPDYHGVESVAFQAVLIHLMREEMFRKRQYFEIIPITHKVQKEARIRGVLQPRYAAGYIMHARPFPELEEELLDFPAKHDDNIDAEAMCITLLDPQAADAADPTKSPEDDEFEEINYGEYAHAP